MSVVGNYLTFSPNCKIKIYTLDKDGFVIINPKLLILWKAFLSPVMVKFQFCDDPSYILPTNNFTSFTGKLDTLSGFVFFKRVPPIQFDSPVLNEGIALDVFNTAIGRYPGIRFDYEGSSDITETRIYCLLANADYLSLITDYDNHITRYTGSRSRKGSVTIPNNGLLYFKIYTNTPSTSTFNITCECVEPPQPLCDVSDNTCLRLYDNSVTLTNNIALSNTDYDIVPYPQWKTIADLILSTFITTRVPIPLTPIIPPNVQNTYTILCEDDSSVNGLIAMYYHSLKNEYYTQYGFTSSPIKPNVSSSIVGSPSVFSLVPLKWISEDIYWSVTPVLFDANFNLFKTAVQMDVLVTFTFFVEAASHPIDADIVLYTSDTNFTAGQYFGPGLVYPYYMGNQLYRLITRIPFAMYDLVVKIVNINTEVFSIFYTLQLDYSV